MSERILKNPDGVDCPSVTTILDIINKPFLLQWANKLGKEGKDVDEEKSRAARGGTVGHEMIQHTLGGPPVNERAWSAGEIEEGRTVLSKFEHWRSHGGKVKSMRTILMEERIFSGLGYCGAMDWYGEIDGYLTLLDFKTGKSISPEYIYQLAAYKKMLMEKGHRVQKVRLLRFGRKLEWGWTDEAISPKQLVAGWKVFTHAFKLWKIKRAYEEQYEKRWRG